MSNQDNHRPLRIMIAVPSMEMVHADFALHLAMATAYMTRAGLDVRCAFNIGSLITSARRELVKTFLEGDADFIWWLDSDMKFPIDAAIRLLNRRKAIVGVNYRRRRFPNPTFTGMNEAGDGYAEFMTAAHSPDMERIDALPHGCVLVRRAVYERIPHPHYLQEYMPGTNSEIAEDLYFCKQAKKAGFEIWCDQALSREVAHIGVFHFTYDLSVPGAALATD